MKKIFLSFAVLGSIIFGTSCNKPAENPAPGAQTQATSQKDDNGITYVDVSGNRIPESAVDQSLDYVLAYDYNNATIHYFRSENEAQQYCQQTGNFPDLLTRINAIQKVRDFAVANGVDLNRDDDPPQAVKDFIDETCGGLGQKGTGVGILYEHVNCTSAYGSTCGISGNPQFSLFGFRNRASAAKGVGLANMLWDRTWFRGPSVYLLLGTASTIPLALPCGLNYNDRAESCW